MKKINRRQAIATAAAIAGGMAAGGLVSPAAEAVGSLAAPAGVGVEADPALISERAHLAAEKRFNTLWFDVETIEDEMTAEYRQAEDAIYAETLRFADAVPTSPAGAAAKLRNVLRVDYGLGHYNRSTPRHLKAVLAYLDRLAGAA